MFGFYMAMNIQGNVVVTGSAAEASIKVYEQEENGSWNQLGATLADEGAVFCT